MAKKGKKPACDPTVADHFREKFQKLDKSRKKGTEQAIARRRQDVWEMMCQGIPKTEIANILGVHRATIALDVKWWRGRVKRRVAKMKDDPEAANVELGLTITKLDTLTEAAFQEYSTAKTGCLTADSQVWLADDIRAIIDVSNDDDAVLYAGGEAATAGVVGLIPNGVRPVFNLRTRHREIRATANHPFLKVNKDGTECWTELRDLRIGDAVVIATAMPASGDPPQMTPLLDAELSSSFVRLSAVGRIALDSRRDVWSRSGYRGAFLRDHGLTILWNHIRSGRHGVQLSVLQNLFQRLDIALAADHYDFTQGRGGRQSMIQLPERITPDFCRLYGFWLADGWINESSKATTLVANPGHDEGLANYYLGLMQRVNPNAYIRQTDGCFNIYSTSVTLAGVFRRLGWKDGAHHKRLPSWIWNLPDTYKEAMLIGFIDGDGCVRQVKPHRAEITTIELCNVALVRDLKSLVDGLGYSCGHVRFRDRRTNVTGKNGRPIVGGASYAISFTRNKMTRPFATEMIASVVEEESEEVFDLEVADDAHNFVADGFVVHNSEKDKFLNTAGKLLSTKTRILQESGYLPKAGIEVKTKVEHQITFADRFGKDSPLSELDDPTGRHKILDVAQRLIGLASQQAPIDVEGVVKDSPAEPDDEGDLVPTE